MWSNFAPHKKCWWSCGTKLLHMTSYLAPHDTIVCHVEKLQMWINDTFFLLLNFAPHDKFTMYAVLSWFTLFWRKIHFVAINALLCGANINPKILSVEQKWQIWCMVSTCSNQQCNDVTISRRLFCTFLYFLGNFFTPFPTPVCGLNMVHPTMQQGTFWMLVFWLLGALFFFTPPLSQPNLRL